MSQRLLVTILVVLGSGPVGCSDEVPATGDAAISDSGADAKLTPDQPKPDAEVTPDKDPAATCDATKVGSLCTADSQCGKNGLCLLVKGTTKICTCKCTPDDIKTTMINEDTCPNQGSTKGKLICGTTNAPGIVAGSFCLQVCEPKLDANDCAKGVSCSTMSEYYAGVIGIGVCLVAGCATDVECPSITGMKCNTLAQDCAKGETCAPLNLANLFAGRCFANGKCDTKSGLCRGQTGKAGIKIGAPCEGDPDCGPNQECRFEMDRQKDLGQKPGGSTCLTATECCSGKCTAGKCTKGSCGVMFRNGYCTIRACKFSKSLTHTKCPAGSVCNMAFIGGMCQKTCSLTSKTDCRGQAKDRLGDYECRSWDKLQTAGGAIAEKPVCDFGFTLTCDQFAAQGITCAAVGAASNTTNMACRSLQDKKLSSHDPSGYCLDDTASGPVAVTAPDGGTVTPDGSTTVKDAGTGQ